MRRFLSLGAGVQSSALYLMAVHGEFPEPPEAAIFADTQWEPRAVYDWLEQLRRIGEDLAALGGPRIPIWSVTAGNIRNDALAGDRFATMPLRVRSKGEDGRLRRQCTREYKVAPISKRIRAKLGVEPRYKVREEVELWMGISLDEVQRMKPNRFKWLVNRWPLIEREMDRRRCEAWLVDHGYPIPPKSACIGCPYTDDRRWREMKENRPEEWADAVDFDARIRQLPRIKGEVFIHRSLRPLPIVDLSTQEDHGQLDAFTEECEGLCGV